MKNTKSGSVFVEAAVIFPLIITAVALLINYAHDNYDFIKDQSERHNSMREESMNEDVVKKDECTFIRTLDLLLWED